MGEIFDLVIDCENQLGWQPKGSKGLHRERASACARLERAIAKAEPPVTIADLRLALALCKSRRESIDQPAHLLRHVTEARKKAVVREVVTDVSQAVTEAIDWERRCDDLKSDEWISRLVRCHDSMRGEVLAEWREAGRGGGT